MANASIKLLISDEKLKVAFDSFDLVIKKYSIINLMDLNRTGMDL